MPPRHGGTTAAPGETGGQKNLAQPPGLNRPRLLAVFFKDDFLLRPAPRFHFPACQELIDSPEYITSVLLRTSAGPNAGRIPRGRDGEKFCILALGWIPTGWKGEGKNNDRGCFFFFFPKNRNVTLLSSTPSAFLQQAFCALVIIYFSIAYFAPSYTRTQAGVYFPSRSWPLPYPPLAPCSGGNRPGQKSAPR